MGGVKVKMDDEGNILVKRVSKSNVYVKITSAGEETSIGNDILKLSNCALEIDKPVKNRAESMMDAQKSLATNVCCIKMTSYQITQPPSTSWLDASTCTLSTGRFDNIQQNSSALRIPTPLIPFPRLVGIFKLLSHSSEHPQSPEFLLFLAYAVLYPGYLYLPFTDGMYAHSTGAQLFDMKKFQNNVSRELHRAYPDRRRLEMQCLSVMAFVKNEPELLDSPIWVLIINVVALDMLKSKLPPGQ
uniref:(California timema) hypothetical protein n=1 Tax=Timema californicum TaxID=61474 RepID=A0A7R9JIQ6_TIMCA|nr:unnamed protein product [Timema californicum]